MAVAYIRNIYLVRREQFNHISDIFKYLNSADEEVNSRIESNFIVYPTEFCTDTGGHADEIQTCCSVLKFCSIFLDLMK